MTISRHSARMSGRLSHPSQQVAVAMIACAMLLRALIPAGWMPAADARGAIHLAMCSGMGPQTASMDHTGKVHKDMPSGGHRDTQPCGFAVLGHGLDDLPILTLPMPLLRTASIAPGAKHAVSVGRGLAAPPPPSTGPPYLI
ncbi:MAG: DUF2946 family protein [Sphingomonas sp.]|nr:DUF2946 family protein [Sphingomonas sp.]